MDIDYKTVYQAGPTDVLDILTDFNFLRDCATELGADSHEADVSRSGDSRSVTLRLVAPTDEIDAVFKSLVGPEITVTDTRSWEPDGGRRLSRTPARRSDCERTHRHHQWRAKPDPVRLFDQLHSARRCELEGAIHRGAGSRRRCSTRHRLDGGSGAVPLAGPDGLTRLIKSQVGQLCQEVQKSLRGKPFPRPRTLR